MTSSLLSAVKRLPLDKLQFDIVSASLCDDVLQRLAPSLAPYVGSTIIDINPGVGLFSTKIHQLLKPRSHVLLEPRQKRYEPFLKPLLDSPGSRYHIRDWPDEHRWNPTNYIQEGLMPALDDHQSVGSRPSNPRSPALIIANLSGPTSTVGARFKTRSDPIFHAMRFARDCRQAAKSNSEPPPRMLIWMSDSMKQSILPRTVEYRGKLSFLLESYSHVEEIVTTPSRSKFGKREDALNEKGKQRVAALMEKNKVQIPPGRMRPEDVISSELTTISRDWYQELDDLEEAFRLKKFSQFVGHAPAPSIRRKGGPKKKKEEENADQDTLTFTPKFHRMQHLRYALKSQKTATAKFEAILQEQERIDALNLRAYRDDVGETERENILREVRSRSEDLQEKIGGLDIRELNRLLLLDDNRRAFSMDPPLLLWDRRSAEPLVARSDEFFHPAEVALLDFQPRNDFADITPTTTEQDIYYETIANTLLTSKGPVTLKNLDKAGPGAYKALVKEVPALRDPRQGGRENLDSLRARVLKPEMINKLALAWDNWLFKPRLSEILNQTQDEVQEMGRGGGPASRGII